MRWLLLLVLAGCAPRPAPVIALLTDYGPQDSYVGELKGAIYTLAPDARVTDLTHAIPPYEVREGAHLLGRIARRFPAGTVFVVVVDPGVGTARRGIAVRSAKGKFYVGPDNGLFTHIYDDEAPCTVRELADRRFWRDPGASGTFHGRDIFGPVAAHLSRGVSLDSLGPAVADPVRLATTPVRRDGAVILGEIVHVDVYGNCSTNIPGSLLDAEAYEVGGLVFPRRSTYGGVPAGEPVLVLDAEGMVELARNRASAARKSGWKAGTPLRLRPIRRVD